MNLAQGGLPGKPLPGRNSEALLRAPCAQCLAGPGRPGSRRVAQVYRRLLQQGAAGGAAVRRDRGELRGV